jgi:hypothetical protein
MPPISWPDVWKLLLPRSADAFDLLVLRDPPLQINPSSGGQDILEPALRFLNYPLHARSLDGSGDTYAFSGWYFKSGRDWISLELTSPTKAPVSVQFDRRPSPDIQNVFKDSLASDQRFTFQTRCSDDCTLVLRAPTGEVVEKKLAEFKNAPFNIDLGKGHLHVDFVKSDAQYAATGLDRVCAWFRIAVLSRYSWLFLPILALGFVAFVASALTYRGRAVWNVCFVMALVCWGLAFSRTALLLLIEVTSFPALNGLYIAPAHYLLVAAAGLSIAAWAQQGANEQIPVE